MLDRLSIVYPKQVTLNPYWFAEFEACFTDPRVERIEVLDGNGSVQSSRGLAINLATREFLVSPDPDDLFEMGAFEQAIAYLDQHPEVMAVALLEERFNQKGDVIDVTPARPLMAIDVLGDPMAMHNATVFRTAVIQEAVDKLSNTNYDRYDWVLRMYVAGNYPVARLPLIGYRYRWHNTGHRMAKTPIASVSAFDAYEHMERKGMVRYTRQQLAQQARHRGAR